MKLTRHFIKVDRRFGQLDECTDGEDDIILSHISRMINTTDINEENLPIDTLSYLYESFKKIYLFEGSGLSQIIDGSYEILSYVTTYVTTYFPVQFTPIELWKNVFKIRKHNENKKDWSLTLLIIGICLCAPHSNDALERFVSLLKYVRSTRRQSSDALMRVEISRPPLDEFHSTNGRYISPQM